jgi:hypothetical protein
VKRERMPEKEKKMGENGSKKIGHASGLKREGTGEDQRSAFSFGITKS